MTAELDDGRRAECRLWVGRGMARSPGGLRLPEALRQRGQTLLGEVKGRIEVEGFRILDGMVAHGAEAVDGAFE